MQWKTTLCLILLNSVCIAQNGTTKSVAATGMKPQLRSELKTFEPFLGTWVLENHLKDGRPFWAKSQYTVGMDGNFVVEKMFSRNHDGKEYQRYHAIWRWNKEHEKIVSHGFRNDGTYEESEPTLEVRANGMPMITTISASPGSPVATQQTMELIDGTSYQWNVSSSAAKDNPIMEGIWNKQKSEEKMQ